jgi:Spy/CpxP family protein refolding chaperone
MNLFKRLASPYSLSKNSATQHQIRPRTGANASASAALWAALIFCSSLPAQAQNARPEPGGDNPVEKRIGELREKLKLTDEQVTKLRESFREQAPELKKIREDSSLSDAQKREKLREIFKTNFEKIGPLLTPEQKTALAAMRSQGPESGKSPDGPAFLRIESLKEQLNLTDAQTGKISPILKDTLGKLRALREEGEASGRREKVREILETARDQVAAELTPDQKQKFREWATQNRPPGGARPAK